MFVQTVFQRSVCAIALSTISIVTHAAMSYSDINSAYFKSYSYEKSNNYSDAAKVLSGVYNEYPATYTVNVRLGYLHLMNKNYDTAISYYEKANKAVPTSVDPKLGLMLVYLTLGKYDKVELYGAQVTKIDYYNYYANLRLAIAQRMQKNFAAAEKTLLKMLDLYPADVSLLSEYGAEQYAAGKVQNAASVLSSVITLDPQNATANAILKQIVQSKK